MHSTSASRSRKYSAIAHQRRFVGGRDDHDRAGQALGAEILGDEFLDFAAALADQADDVDVGGSVAGDHADQHRFADTRAGEDAHALAAAAGQEGVQGADAEVHFALDTSARMRRRRARAEKIGFFALRQRAQSVERLAQRIDDSAAPGGTRADRHLAFDHVGPATEAHTFESAERHQQRATTAKADNLAQELAGAATLDAAVVADREPPLHAAHFEEKPLDRGHPPVEAICGNLIQTGIHSPKRVGHRPTSKK